MKGCQETYEDEWQDFHLACDLDAGHVDPYHHDKVRGLHWRKEDNASLIPAIPSF